MTSRWPVHGRHSDGYVPGAFLVGGASVHGQQDLRAFEFADGTGPAEDHRNELDSLGRVESYAIPCNSLWLHSGAFDQIDVGMSSTVETPRFTEKQSQYLAFIYMYPLVNGRAPAQADMQRFFEVTPPSVHSMVVELERRGLIRRVPRRLRSIEVTVEQRNYPCSNRSKPL